MPGKNLWRDSIRPRIAVSQATLGILNAGDLIRQSGGTRCQDGIALSLFETPLCIVIPSFEVRQANGDNCQEETQILVLDYLTRSVGTTPPENVNAGRRWLGFQELPNGAFYAAAFRSYTSAVLERELSGGIADFQQACEGNGGRPFSLGDAAFSFRALPHIDLGIVWWAGDDEFPATATVLFDRSAAHALPIDGLAALGRLLCQGLIRAARTLVPVEHRTMEPASETLGRSGHVEDPC
ncbi:DUF3786 domain-containing protein [Candidatus Bipolaricaulota bacterium]|nr:DUF3786 domain-containing protein [Candidatus Bipolaricaulota bacterium]